MVTVQKHGRRRMVKHPVTLQLQEMVPVTYVEEDSKRPGGNSLLSESSDVLDEILGVETGLGTFRTHTQLVRPEALNAVPVGKQLNLYINRILTSTPAMIQQENARPRIIEGKPTFFQTSLSKTPKADIDVRMDNNIVADKFPELFANAQLNGTSVDEIDEQGNNLGDTRSQFASRSFSQQVGESNQQLESSVATGAKKEVRAGAQQGN